VTLSHAVDYKSLCTQHVFIFCLLYNVLSVTFFNLLQQSSSFLSPKCEIMKNFNAGVVKYKNQQITSLHIAYQWILYTKMVL